MNFTVLIPARLQSTRLPDKPLADIHGAPMVVRVAQQAARTTIGAPWMSASGLSGRRVDFSRAGISTVKFMWRSSWRAGSFDRRRRGSFHRRRRRGRVERARFALQHHRDAVAHRKRHAIGRTLQLAQRLARLALGFQGALAQRADQQVDQTMVHGAVSARRWQPLRQRSADLWVEHEV